MKPSRKDWLLWLGVFGVAGLLIIAFRGRWGLFQADLATFDAVMLILIVFFMQETLVWFKHRTPKLIYDGNPGHTTFFVKDLRKVGMWGVARKGGIIAAGVYWPGSEGTLIAPYDSFSAIGDCIICTSKVENSSLGQLPESVRKYVSDNRLPMPVEFGISTNQQLRIPDVAQLNKEILVLNRRVASLKQTLTDVMAEREDLASYYRKMQKKESLTSELKRALIEVKGE